MKKILLLSIPTPNEQSAPLRCARADDYSYQYTEKTGHDSRVDEVWFDETEDVVED